MINGKRVLAIIPARGGSKGIKNKNIRLICGRHLIEYSIDAGLQSRYVDFTCVTTDSQRIANIAKKAGAQVPFLRPKELASDKAKSIDAILHALSWLRTAGEVFDIVVLLQPTSPLRNSTHVDAALEQFEENGEMSLVSVNQIEASLLLYRSFEKGALLQKVLNVNSTVRRQDFPVLFKVNGAIYINRADEFSKELSLNDNKTGFVMDPESSVDVDAIADLKRCRSLAKTHLQKRRSDFQAPIS